MNVFSIITLLSLQLLGCHDPCIRKLIKFPVLQKMPIQSRSGKMTCEITYPASLSLQHHTNEHVLFILSPDSDNISYPNLLIF